jgi:hypothetical protein
MTLRRDLLKIASELPVGDPTRRELLSALKDAVKAPKPGDPYYDVWEESRSLQRDFDRAFPGSSPTEDEVVDWLVGSKPSSLAAAFEVYVAQFPGADPSRFERLWKARGGPRLKIRATLKGGTWRELLWRVMRQVEATPGDEGRIARELGMSERDVSEALDRLARSGFVFKGLSGWALTPQGERRVKAAKVADWSSAPFDIKAPVTGLSATDVADLVKRKFRGSDIDPDSLEWGRVKAHGNTVGMPFTIMGHDPYAGRDFEIIGEARVMIDASGRGPAFRAEVVVNR